MRGYESHPWGPGNHDFWIEDADRISILEVNELQHHYKYSIEKESRPLNTFKAMAVAGITKPLIYINFNPDPFKVGRQKINVPRPLRYQRIALLLQEYRLAPFEN